MPVRAARPVAVHRFCGVSTRPRALAGSEGSESAYALLLFLLQFATPAEDLARARRAYKMIAAHASLWEKCARSGGELRPAPQCGSLLQAMTARRPRDSSGLAHPSDRTRRSRNPRKRCGSPVGKMELFQVRIPSSGPPYCSPATAPRAVVGAVRARRGPTECGVWVGAAEHRLAWA